MVKRVRPIHEEDLTVILLAQEKVVRVYKRLGNWRAVAEKLGLKNVAIAWAFVKWGEIPKRKDLRCKLFLPRVLPSERKPKAKRARPLWGEAAGVDIGERLGKE